MTPKEATLIYNSYNYSQKGRMATILPNAMQAIKDRGWHIKGMEDYTMKVGIVDYEFGKGTSDNHIAITFPDGEQYGFVPETIKIFPF